MFVFAFGGRRLALAFGGYSVVDLVEAREKREQRRKMMIGWANYLDRRRCFGKSCHPGPEASAALSFQKAVIWIGRGGWGAAANLADPIPLRIHRVVTMDAPTKKARTAKMKRSLIIATVSFLERLRSATWRAPATP